MKNIELFWNIVYFGIYQFDISLRYLIGFLNPFNFINKIKGVQRYHSTYGVNDLNKFRNRIFNSKKSGISSIRSSAIIGGLLVLFEYGLFNFIQGITKKALIANVWEDSSHFFIYLIVLLIPVVLINNYLLFKNDKYLNYFEQFEKEGKRKKSSYYFLSIITVLLFVSFFFLSFLLL